MDSMKTDLGPAQMARIQADADQAVKSGLLPVEACPWPFRSVEGIYWVNCWKEGGGVYPPNLTKNEGGL